MPTINIFGWLAIVQPSGWLSSQLANWGLLPCQMWLAKVPGIQLLWIPHFWDPGLEA